MELDAENRDVNFTEPKITAEGGISHDVLFKALLDFALPNIVTKIDTADDVLVEIFRTDEALWRRLNPGSTKAGVLEQVRRYLREHRNVPVNLGWPREDVSLPFVSVVLGDNEMSDVQMIGGIAGFNRQDLRQVYQVGEKSTINLFCSTSDANFTSYLAKIVKWVFWFNCLELEGYHSVRGLTIATRDVRHSVEYLPRFCYTRVVMLKFETDFQWSRVERLIKLVSVDLTSYGVHVKSGITTEG